MNVPQHLTGELHRGNITMCVIPKVEGTLKCRYRRGRSYAVHGQLRVLVHNTSSQDLYETTHDQALRCGFEDIGDFYRWWEETHGLREEQPVWVVEFVLDRGHHARLLHRQSWKGYTENTGQAMWPDAGEAVPKDVQSALTADAKANWDSDDAVAERRAERDRAAARRTRPIRLAEVERRAKLQGRTSDIRNDLRVIDERLERAERKLDPNGEQEAA